jgi:urease accessory protein
MLQRWDLAFEASRDDAESLAKFLCSKQSASSTIACDPSGSVPALKDYPMRLKLSLSTLFAIAAAPASAHTGHDVLGFSSGFFHPVMGVDHVIAMLAVGLWAALLGGRALYALPIVFPLVMMFGGILGMNGNELPYVEPMIAMSGVVLGLMVALCVKPALWISALMVGVFAVFHGQAHGAELPAASNPVGYAAGFVIATALLHLTGIGLGSLVGAKGGEYVTRATGVLIALTGAAFLVSAV